MNFFEDRLQQLAPKEMEGNLADGGIPSINHCAGTGKLLGEFGGKALCQVCEIEHKETIAAISLLSTFLRAFIVLDDFIRDNRPSVVESNNIGAWLTNIKEEIIQLLSMFTDEPSYLWIKYYSVYAKAYDYFNKEDLYKSILEKCFLMFLPFEIEPLQRSKKNRLLKQCMAHYLFSLQLLDDFHDMEEDLRSPKNHNLFLVSVLPDYFQNVIDGRPVLINPLLNYIERNLGSIEVFDNDIIKAFVEYGLNWIREQKIRFSNLTLQTDMFRGKYEDFGFSDDDIKRFILNIDINHEVNFGHIRAENMHTISLGTHKSDLSKIEAEL